MAVKKLGDSEPEDDGSNSMDDKDMRPVVMPSGTVHHIHHSEVDSFNDRMKRYMEDTSFTNNSDLSDFERLMIFEQLVLRWSNWLSTGRNYRGDRIDDKETQERVKHLSAEIRNIKKSLTIDKESRDKQRAADDVGNYIETLIFRAKHFGYKRNEEFATAMELFNELEAKFGLYERCDERDRIEQGVRLEDIHAWWRGTAWPLYAEIDRKFRQETPDGVEGFERKAVEGGQKMWVRSQ